MPGKARQGARLRQGTMLRSSALAPSPVPRPDGSRSCSSSSTGPSLGSEATGTRGLGVCHLREGNAGGGCVVGTSRPGVQTGQTVGLSASRMSGLVPKLDFFLFFFSRCFSVSYWDITSIGAASRSRKHNKHPLVPRACAPGVCQLWYLCRAPSSTRLHGREGRAPSPGSDAADRVWIRLQKMDEVLAQTGLEQAQVCKLGVGPKLLSPSF